MHGIPRGLEGRGKQAGIAEDLVAIEIDGKEALLFAYYH